MDEAYSTALSQHSLTALYSLIAMLVTSSIAYFKGFYRLEPEEKINIKIIHFLSVIFIYILVNIIIGLAITKILKSQNIPMYTIGFSTILYFVLNSLTICGFIFFCYLTRNSIFKDIIKRKSIYSSSMLFDAFIGIVSLFLIFPMMSFVAEILEVFTIFIFKVVDHPEQDAINFVKHAQSDPIYFTLAFIEVVIFAPIIEEFLFRGIIHNFIKKYLGRFSSIILTNIAFAMMHFSSSQKLSNISILGSIFVLGCFLSFLYERQKSLISPIFLHAINNLVIALNIMFFKGV